MATPDFYDVYCSLTGVQVQMKFKYAIAFDLISSSWECLIIFQNISQFRPILGHNPTKILLTTFD